eukprot:6674849-Lingulodinium_polyedra.AAC.1
MPPAAARRSPQHQERGSPLLQVDVLRWPPPLALVQRGPAVRGVPARGQRRHRELHIGLHELMSLHLPVAEAPSSGCLAGVRL